MVGSPYVNGSMHGIEKTYYASGVLQIENPRVNGFIHGVSKHYYSSGALCFVVPYVNGEKHVIEKHYDKDNLNIDRLTLYKRDREVLVLRLESYGTASTKSYI